MAKDKIQSKSLDDTSIDESAENVAPTNTAETVESTSNTETSTPVDAAESNNSEDKPAEEEKYVIFYNSNNYDVSLKYKDDIFIIPPGAVTDKFNAKDVNIDSLIPGVNYRFV